MPIALYMETRFHVPVKTASLYLNGWFRFGFQILAVSRRRGRGNECKMILVAILCEEE
jgi:hypothetical protein